MDEFVGMRSVLAMVLLSFAAQAAEAAGVNQYAVQLFGVPLSVIGMAAAGSMMSFAFGAGEKSRLRLFMVAIACTFIGAAAVTVVPAAFQFKWVSPVIEPPLGFFFALFSRWAVPMVVEVGPAFLRSKLGVQQPKPGDEP